MKSAMLLAVALASACSPILTRRPPYEREPLRWPACTEHRLYALADAWVAGAAITGVYLLVTDEAPLAVLGIPPLVVTALVAGGSAIYGLHQTGRCRSARRAYEAAALEGR